MKDKMEIYDHIKNYVDFIVDHKYPPTSNSVEECNLCEAVNECEFLFDHDTYLFVDKIWEIACAFSTPYKSIQDSENPNPYMNETVDTETIEKNRISYFQFFEKLGNGGLHDHFKKYLCLKS